jgi:hypothetical protein
LTVPKQEGSYRLRVTLVRRPEGFASRLAPWDKGSELAGRNIGFVVVDPQARLPRLTDDWETVSTIDATSSSWWQRVPQWTQVEKLPGFTTPRPLGNVKPLISPVGNSLVELPPTSPAEDLAWQAYLLPVRNVGEPHAVEIEVPRALRQHLTVSIIEPDAAGRVQTFGRDWGVFSDDRAGETADGDNEVAVHRIVFWPRSKSPAVVIANRSHQRGALYGKIRLQRRKTAVPPSDALHVPRASRLAAAYTRSSLPPIVSRSNCRLQVTTVRSSRSPPTAPRSRRSKGWAPRPGSTPDCSPPPAKIPFAKTFSKSCCASSIAKA